MKKNITFCLILICLALPIISAVQLNSGTILNTTASNTSLTFNGRTVTAETATIQNYNITLSGVYYPNGSIIFVNFTTPFFFNHTNSNIDSGLYPSLTLDSRKTKTITNQLSQTLNADVITNISDSCNNLYKIYYTSSTGAYTKSYSKKLLIFGDYDCSNSQATFSVTGIENGVNTLTYSYNYDRGELAPYCSALESGFSSFGDLITLIILAVIFVIVIGMLSNGTMDFRGFLITAVLTIVFVGIINVFGAIVITYMC